MLLICLGLMSGLAGCITSHQEPPFTLTRALAQEKAGWDRVPSILRRIQVPTFPSDTFDVRDFGAKGDSSNDLPAIQAAIAACAEAGGGTVYFSPGVYFCAGPIHLRSYLDFHLSRGAKLCFSQQAEDYLPAVKVRWEGTVCYNYSPLIYGYQLENVALTGAGLIDGQGMEWSETWRRQQKPDQLRLRQMGNDTVPDRQRVFAAGFLDQDGDGQDDGYGDGQLHYLRPTLLELYQCRNLLIEGLTFQQSPFWTVHPVFCQNLTLRNLTIHGSTLNDDGIDLDSCEDALVEGCTIETRDDAIAIKAGRDQDAWSRPGSQYIVIRHNRLLSGANALCIGSEMSGGVSQVFAEHNFIANGQHALNFKCNLDRGGEVSHIYLRDLDIEQCRDAMFIFRMDYHGYRGNHFPTEFHNFYVRDIRCGPVAKRPFKIVGVPEAPIRRILLTDITVGSGGEPSLVEHAQDILWRSVSVAGVGFSAR
ncbi:MAG: glycosyl hydrolase family 28 protein [Bacteroidota bacterium]